MKILYMGKISKFIGSIIILLAWIALFISLFILLDEATFDGKYTEIGLSYIMTMFDPNVY